MEELVVLVDDNNNQIGTAPKATVHTNDTPLHRGFSVFLFNKKGQFLLTRRAYTKKTFPGVLTNSFCGHPAPGETVEDAARRRVFDELGIKHITITKTIPYRYKVADQNGIVENEICPPMIAYTDEEPVMNPDEVAEYTWIDWKTFLQEIKKHPQKYSLWCREEALLVDTALQQKGS
jgi:isopentenyl-diphosphate delta-isomerase type 1